MTSKTIDESKQVLPGGLYCITAEKFSCNRSNIEVVSRMIDSGVKVIQYREKRKYKEYRDIIEECCSIREITKKAGVTFIVNDYVDIALLVDADGVHVGQEDMSVQDVRKLLGTTKIIGLSTHSPDQAKEAIEVGADYIGVGPIFATNTKEDVCDPVGFSYLDWVIENISLPFVAIGGIKKHNIDQIAKRGVKNICLVTEIVGAPDIESIISEIQSAF